MRAILIDPPNKAITEIDFEGDYKAICELIKADLMTAVNIDGGHTIYLDDEGLINGNPHGWFVIESYPQPLRGYGLILGTNYATGDNTACTLDIDELRARVAFPADDELAEPESYAMVTVESFDNSDDFLRALGLG